MSERSPSQPGLRRAIGGSGFFTLAFGAVVGSGWVVVLGEWLRQAGPGGSALAFLAGGLVMIIVALCYGELAARAPMAGGEFLYTLQSFGPFPAFLVGWFLTFAQISVCAFEGIALAWLARVLFPGIALDTAYTVGGNPVTWDALIIGLGSALVIALLHLKGAGSAIRFQNVVTFGFIAISIVLVICGLLLGSPANLAPLFSLPSGNAPLFGALWVFATTAYFFNGWQAAMHAIEERGEHVSVRRAVWCMVAGIAAAAVFYCAIIIASSMATPWRALIGLELPAAAAFSALGAGGILGSIVLIAAIISLAKTWSACAWIATRLLYSQSRHGLLPRLFGELDPSTRAPRNAVVFVTVLSMLGVALGRSAILPIVDTLAICAALSIILCLVVLLRQRRLDRSPALFTVPGGIVTIVIALSGAVAMVGSALVQPVIVHGRVPIEWLFLAIWAAAGVAWWYLTRRVRGASKPASATAP